MAERRPHVRDRPAAVPKTRAEVGDRRGSVTDCAGIVGKCHEETQKVCKVIGTWTEVARDIASDVIDVTGVLIDRVGSISVRHADVAE